IRREHFRARLWAANIGRRSCRQDQLCGVGEEDVDLAGADLEGFGVEDGFGLGGSGVSIAINSETVTNLNPFASSSFNTHGIASIVPGWMSCAKTIEPARVFFTIRLHTTFAPGLRQSRGSTSQSTIL